MQALIVYESMFGNTRQIAEAVAEGLRTGATVELVEVADAPARIGGDVGLLVVGAPTHAFSLSRAATRADAADQARAAGLPGPRSTDEGLREWLLGLPVPPWLPAAAFDTRVRRPLLPGSAAHAAARRLRRAGCHVLDRGRSFYVTGTPGPLVDGELERGREWGRELAARDSQSARSARRPQRK
jgi:flavodoxin-like protein